MDTYDDYKRAYQCINGCLPFETLGVPSRCCHCGTSEVYPFDPEAKLYDKPDEIYERHRDRTDTEL